MWAWETGGLHLPQQRSSLLCNLTVLCVVLEQANVERISREKEAGLPVAAFPQALQPLSMLLREASLVSV
jgi:hypothetical protein